MSQVLAAPVLTSSVTKAPSASPASADSAEGAEGFAALVADAEQGQAQMQAQRDGSGTDESGKAEGGEAESSLTGQAAVAEKPVAEGGGSELESADTTAQATDSSDSKPTTGDQSLPAQSAERQWFATEGNESGASKAEAGAQALLSSGDHPDAAETGSDGLLAQLAALDKAKRQMDGAEPAPSSEGVDTPAAAPLQGVGLSGQPAAAEIKPDSGLISDPKAPLTPGMKPAPAPLPGSQPELGTATPGGQASVPAAPGLVATQPDGEAQLDVVPGSRLDWRLGGADATLPVERDGTLLNASAANSANPTSAALLASANVMAAPVDALDPALGGEAGEALDLDPARQLQTDTVHRQQARSAALADSTLLRQPVAAERLAPELRERLAVMINTDRMTAELRLDPPELGALQVRIQMNGDQAQVQIQTQHAQARDLLEQALPRLREMLQGQGIQLADANVSHQQHSEGQADGGSDFGGQGGQGGVDGGAEDAVAHQISNRNAEGGIDFYA
ncbi:flagellar hook-length control protein FliK [Ferrimonas balearica]|uniref:flagellar hook-length control protein FliK n=1 Tax=Ferrimonas balearica TaxID=44012 RepID=UPI001F1C0AAE|nr:flagellar hook-length control protein FliK [Ferrimonas balearica]MBY6094584.1 flagellar hook-length control protein FliK [Ferrimonas balearica]